MTTNIHWMHAVDGDFANSNGWSGGGAPNSSQNAVLDAAGGAFTVTSSVNAAVLGVQLSSNATLDISAGTFSASAGTNGGENAGVILVTGGAQLTIGGAIDNVGGITLSGEGNYKGSSMFLASATTLTGGGTVSLESTGYAYEVTISGGKKASLTNVDNTITGRGVIGASAGFKLVNDAAGVIGPGLILGSFATSGFGVKNTGLIEATAIYGATISGKGGMIASQSETDIKAVDCAISGQKLMTAAQSGLQLDYSTLTIHGKIQDAGGIQLETSTATLTGATTLGGGGYLTLTFGSEIKGVSPSVALRNAGDKIYVQGGNLGGGSLSISNAAGGSITGFGTIASGAGALVNAGAILATTGPGDVTLVVAGAVENDGTLGAVNGATLVAQGAVNGAGQVLIQAGAEGAAADFVSAFSQNVGFVQVGQPGKGASAVSTLELGQSQGFKGSVSGFSQNGLTAFDLADIGFVSPGEATFSGSKTSGVLTISDGAHTTHVTLVGDFTGAAFTASSDGHGGTTVVAGKAQAPHGSPHAFIAAMASLGAASAASVHSGQAWSAHETMLSMPRTVAA